MDTILDLLSITESSTRQLCATRLLGRAQGNWLQLPTAVTNWKVFLGIGLSSFPVALHQFPHPVSWNPSSLCLRLSFLGAGEGGEGVQARAGSYKDKAHPDSQPCHWPIALSIPRRWCQAEHAARVEALRPAQQTQVVDRGSLHTERCKPKITREQSLGMNSFEQRCIDFEEDLCRFLSTENGHLRQSTSMEWPKARNPVATHGHLIWEVQPHNHLRFVNNAIFFKEKPLLHFQRLFYPKEWLRVIVSWCLFDSVQFNKHLLSNYGGLRFFFSPVIN